MDVMMGSMGSIVVAFTVALLTPLAAFLASSWVEYGRRKRAYDRLYAGGVRVGMEIDELISLDRDEYVVGPCVVTKFEVGEITLKLLGKGKKHDYWVTFTGREFERLVPVVVTPYRETGPMPEAECMKQRSAFQNP